jgi:hypothetical protein
MSEKKKTKPTRTPVSSGALFVPTTFEELIQHITGSDPEPGDDQPKSERRPKSERGDGC